MLKNSAGQEAPGMARKDLRLFFVLFAASGFSGLIYESIWTQYLKLFLGHAAYAQALVLAVFMGGMALGSLLCSRYSARMSGLLIWYAALEVVIGICAIFFHPLYVRFLDLAYAQVLPALSTPSSVALFKWIAAGLLILPQSILLGMTFPLMTAGLVRRFSAAPGAIVAMLYFTNSIGAAIGVLAAGFIFIGWGGLPGTLIIAGLINILVAAVVWRKEKSGPPFERLRVKAAPPAPAAAGRPFIYSLFLIIALLTGLSSFIYEIGWIRMLSLVLGSSTHAFELMLSAFILGLALGGLWIERRIEVIADPRRYLAFIQVAMGVLAVATLPLYGSTFGLMAWLLRHLPASGAGYVLFNLSSHGIALLIMLPAAFCAGITLPLITTTLLRLGTGERSIGAVYGFNTIGAILGIFLAVHLAMPVLGLKGMIILGAAIDIALGLGLAWWSFPSGSRPLAYTAAGLLAILLPTFGLTLDPDRMASGVYRYGSLLDSFQQRSFFHRDGKTATVSVTGDGKTMSIRTNGKPDASIQVLGDEHALDEETMVLAGTIGVLLHPDARTAAIIGWGSGLTTHAALASSRLDRVDTVEIEPEMVNAAKLFGPHVSRAYTDPRSHLHIEDAKSYFSSHQRKYDLIISEPSNPWVSGVAGLFTQEFYSRIREYLNENGMFIQWIQLYEIDMPLVASIMNALSLHFSDYAVYAANGSDILILACPAGNLHDIDPSLIAPRELAAQLRRINVQSMRDIRARKIGSKAVLAPLFRSYAVTTNSDYAPVVDLYAVRSRFFRASSEGAFADLATSRLPIVNMLEQERSDFNAGQVTHASYPRARMIHYADLFYHYIVHGEWKWEHADQGAMREPLENAKTARKVLMSDCSSDPSRRDWWQSMMNPVGSVVPLLSAKQQGAFFHALESSPCAKSYSIDQKKFVALLKAIGQREYSLMARYAAELLSRMEGRTADNAEVLEYVLSAGIAGNLASGRIREAGSLRERYKAVLPDTNMQSASLRLLLANLSEAQAH